MKPPIIIVDEHDNVIGQKDRSQLTSGDIYRCTGLWIFNSKGEVLLARRAYSKSHDPGKWGPAAAGTVEVGETYESNIIKEAEEELGLLDLHPIVGPKVYFKGVWSFHGQWYTLELDRDVRDFVLQQEEVAEVAWFSKQTLLKEFSEHPDHFVESASQWLPLFVRI